jgi:hypothetical protein
MSWQLTVTMRQGKDHVLSFETEDEAKAALAEINAALGLHPRLLRKPATIAGQLVVIPVDVRSAEVSEFSFGVA